MQIKRLFLQNVLAVGQEPVEIFFPQTNGITLIKGLNLDVTGNSSNGAGKCCHEDTVLTHAITGERKTIKEWYKSGDDLTVFGLDENLRLSPTKVLAIQHTGTKPIVKVTLGNGTFFQVSTTHPIVTDVGLQISNKLSVGTWVQSPRILPVFGNNSLGKNLIFVLAGMLAEGGLTQKYYTFTNNDPNIIIPMRRALRVFNLDLHGKKGREGLSFDVCLRKCNLSNIQSPHKTFKNLMKIYGLDGKMSSQKEIPPALFSCPKEEVRQFLAMYWSCDGYVSDISTGRLNISVASSSLKMMHGLRMLLLKFGINGRIRTRHTICLAKKFVSYEFMVQGRDSIVLACDLLSQMPSKMKRQRICNIFNHIRSVPPNDNTDLIPSSICGRDVLSAIYNNSLNIRDYRYASYDTRTILSQNQSRNGLRKYADATDDLKLQELANSDVTWVKIVSIEHLLPAPTYDIQIGNETHLYALDSVVTHNSTIIEGILISLYGRTLRREDGKPLTMEAMLHNEDENIEAHVELDYDDTKIVRTFTVKKSHVSYWVNGVRKSTDASATQVKKDLQDHININFETMCSILLFGQHHIFSFLEAGEADRREVFENLLNLKEYNLYEEKAKELRRETKKKIEIFTKSHENTKLHLTSQKAMLENQKDQFRGYIDGLNRDILRIAQEIATIPDIREIEQAWDAYTAAEVAQKDLRDEKDALLKRISSLVDEMLQDSIVYEKRIKEGREPLDDALAAVEKNLAALELKHDGYLREIADQRIAANHITDKLPNIDGDYSNRVEAAGMSSEIFRIKGEIQDIQSRGNAIKKEIAAIKDTGLVANTVCPTCFGQVDLKNAESVIVHHEKDLVSLRNQYAQLSLDLDHQTASVNKSVKALQKEWTDAKVEVVVEKDAAVAKIDEYQSDMEKQYVDKRNTLSKKAKEATSALNDYLTEQSRLNSDRITSKNQKRNEYIVRRSEIDGQIEASKVARPSMPLSQVGTLISKKESLTKECFDKKAALSKNPYSDIIGSLEKSVKEIDDKVDAEVTAIREQEKVLPYYDFWVDAMGQSGIKSFLVDAILPTLNEQISYYLQLIYKGTISVEFDRYLNVNIKNNSSKIGLKRYGQGSGGERRRIDIAIMLAFRQIMKMSTGKDPNLLFLDEIAENFDNTGMEWLYDVLIDLSKISRVYIITHNPGLIGLLENVDQLSVIKKNGAITSR